VNIQNLVSLVKQARKRREIFLFHDNPRSGIDVPESDWNFVINLVTGLFKFYKSRGCYIEVTWWGELFISLPNFETPFEISINHKPTYIKVDQVIKIIKDFGLARISNLDFATSLSLSVRPIRKSTKWYVFPVDINVTEPANLAEKIYEHIHSKISSYYKHDDELGRLRHITKEDLISVIRLGGVLLGRNSILHYLAAELDRRIFISSIAISASRITIDAGRFSEESAHYFGKKELKFFLKYLPEQMVLTDEYSVNY
jgi:hypothetical protein